MELKEDQLLRTAQQWRTTFDSIRDLVSIHDNEFNLVKVNKAFADAFGSTPKELVGKKCYEVIHGMSKPKEGCPCSQTFKTKEPENIEYYEPELGLYLSVSVSPIFDENDQVIGAVHITSDVTRKMESQKEREGLISKLEKVNAELKELAYVISHDMKAPLRGIIGMASLLEIDLGDNLEDEAKENLNLLVSRAKRMEALIEGVLQYSRIGRLCEKYVEIDLNELLKQLVDCLFVPKHITVNVQDNLPKVKYEVSRITQIFQNLLENAIEYANKNNGIINVSCEDEGDFWKFSVEDNGAGIAKEFHERIFGIFQTLQARDERENVGVGLTLVKKIVENYGGEIWLESGVDKGTTFFFTLPKQSQIQQSVEAGKAQTGI